MPEMDTVDEVSYPKSTETTPLPKKWEEIVLPCPPATPAAILGWIANTPDPPWFPSQHAISAGIDRDTLDEPLIQLRIAGLVRIATWVRGVGQGYVLTSAGKKAHATGTGLSPDGKPSEVLSSGSYAAIPDDPPMPLELQASGIQDVQSNWLPIDPRPPVVVPALLIANLLLFLVGLVAAVRAGVSFWTYLLSGDALIAHRFGSVGGLDLLRGEWWRLLTSCFVHGGGIHLVVNLFGLAMIGPLAELVWGRRRFAVIYLLSGLAGSSLAMALHPQNGVVGASGAIWGVLMSLVAWFMIFRTQLPQDVVADAGRRLTMVIAINIMVSFVPGVSWQAHLGGAVTGFTAACLFNAIISEDLNRRRIAIGLIFSLPILTVGGLIVVMDRSSNWIAFRERIAQEQTQRASESAKKSFDKDILPYLNQLNPQMISEEQPARAFFFFRKGVPIQLPPVSRIQQEIVTQSLLPQAKRNPEIVAELIKEIKEKREFAKKAIELLSSPPIGVDSIDRHRERARSFVEAQAQFLDLSAEMLSSAKTPDQESWTAWGNAKRKAEALWLPPPQK